MNTTLALTIIGIVQILVGIIFNLIPKEVNKKLILIYPLRLRISRPHSVLSLEGFLLRWVL